MEIIPVHLEIKEYLKKHNLTRKFEKQIKFLKEDFSHPSLNFEVLEPKHLKIYSFRVDKKYRAVFVFIHINLIEIIDVNNHYK